MSKTTNMWQFNKETQILYSSSPSDEYESQFAFKLTREKDKDTCEEKLVVECFDNNCPNGVVVTNLVDIEKDIKKFLKYGVAFSNVLFMDIVQAIRNYYRDIAVVQASSNANIVNSEVISGVVAVIKEFVKDIQAEGGKNEVDFTTSEFEELLKETEYEKYDTKEIRKALADNGYLITTQGRTSRLKKINGKTVRVVSVNIGKIGEE